MVKQVFNSYDYEEILKIPLAPSLRRIPSLGITQRAVFLMSSLLTILEF